jgi:hypothetical protein
MTTRINPRLINPIASSEGSVASVNASNVNFTSLIIDNSTTAPTAGQGLIWDTATGKYKPGGVVTSGLFSGAVSNVAAYTVTTSMANAIVFPSTAGFSYLVDSILVTNMDTAGATNVTVSSNIVTVTNQEINHCNEIPIPYRLSLELLKKPQVFRPGEILKLKCGGTSTLNATITFERIASNAYVSNAALLTLSNTNVYVSTGAPTVIESIRLVNTGTANVATTMYWANATGSPKAYFVYTLIIPTNCVIEICENVKRLDANDRLVAYTSFANTISAFVSGRVIS